MARVSEKKIIVDPDRYSQLIKPYISTLNALESEFFTCIEKKSSNLVNFKENNNVPKHSWLKYKEGYSSLLVENIIINNLFDKSKAILDPFCGVGTTNLVAQKNGLESIGFDINPIAILASTVKTHYYSAAEIKQINLFIKSPITAKPFVYIELPKVLKSSFTPDVLTKILKLKNQILQVKNRIVHSFLNLALISIVEDCSVRVKDGNGIKLKPNKKYITDVYDYYVSKVESMLADIVKHNYKTKSIFFEKSSIHNLENSVKPGSVSLSIYSPPYANCFDYLEVYKLEVWLGGFANVYDDFRKYRDIAMRSHVNSRFIHQFKTLSKEVDLISEMISCFNIWNKNIPDMIRGYFDDTSLLLAQLYKTLCKGGKVYIIVANSVYKGVIVPTDLLIGRLAKEIGFDVEEIGVARQIRASSQQIPDLNKNNLMRESIIQLIK